MLFLLAQEEFKFSAAWAGHQNVHPVGLLMILAAGLAMLLVHRRHVMVPIIVIAMFVTTAQRVVVGGLDFPFLRILYVLGWIRVLMMGETRGFKMQPLDWAIIWWGIAFFVASMIREGSFVYCCGWMVDNLGAYFLFRVLVRSNQEVFAFVRWMAIFTVPVALAFILEKATRYNIFSVFGGVRAQTWIREGKLRCTGAFQHPILAGCIFSGLFPMFAIAWRGTSTDRRNRFLAGMGMLGAVIVVICCASSTPLGSLVAGIFAMSLYKVRRQVPLLRWSVITGMFILHFFVMKAPIWHLVARIDLTGGSTGYHRYRLIDAAIRHADEWYLIGVRSTAHWGYHLYDVTNHFVLQAVDGGMATLLLFVLMLFFAFRTVSRIVRNAVDPREKWLAWMLGAGLFANCVSFIAVSYFGKALLILMLQLGVLGSLEAGRVRVRARSAPPRSRPWRQQLGATMSAPVRGS